MCTGTANIPLCGKCLKEFQKSGSWNSLQRNETVFHRMLIGYCVTLVRNLWQQPLIISWAPPVLPDRVWMHTKIETREKDKTKREGEMKKCVLDFCHLYENYLTDWFNDSRNAHLCHFAFILVPPPKKISARTIIIYNLSIMLENVTWILLVLYFLCENGIVTQVTLHP